MRSIIRPDVHPTLGWDASKSRNGAVHPMIEILLYSTLSCSDADAIMFRMRNKENLDNQVKIELIEAVKESTPDCYPWDAND
jgi:uncharacterized OsmC-like protein